MLYGAQPQSLGPLIAQANRGTPQRYDFALVGLVSRAQRDPRFYGKPVSEPFLVNQEHLPWVTPTGIPPGYATPDLSSDAAEETAGLPGYDTAAPIWIGIPAEAQAAIDAELDRSSERGKNWIHAFKEDAAGVSGHNVPFQLRYAFAFAVWDGHANIELVHWEAAALYLEMRQLVQAASTIATNLFKGADITREGEDQGLRQDAAETSRARRKSLRHMGCERRLFNLIDAATGLYPDLDEMAAKAVARDPEIFKNGGLNIQPRRKAKPGTSPLDKHLSGPQRDALPAVLADLRKRQEISGDTVIYRAAAAAATSTATVTNGTFRVEPAPAFRVAPAVAPEPGPAPTIGNATA